ncbi:hypothetical protein Chls_105 [Chlamydia suis]|uniref:Uncharacterized protein n=1 Tax=Chlamydia suis TaxID=83559 RepID=A0ABX6IPJ8_9CHLA|nr:hypothetical protein Chls_105 [Chlamydia suis]
MPTPSFWISNTYRRVYLYPPHTHKKKEGASPLLFYDL